MIVKKAGKNFTDLHSLKRTLALVVVFVQIFSLLPYGPMGIEKVHGDVANHVVISEIYGGGGGTGAQWKNDFIELYNPNDSVVSLSGWSIQYASATGTSYNATALTGQIPSHGYYLIQGASGTNGTSLPTPDLTCTLNMSGSAGKVALVSSTTALSGTVDLINNTSIVDYVGYGTTASVFEGSGRAPAPSGTTSIERLANDGTDPKTVGEGKGNGWDTNNNSADFVTCSTITPQNTESPTEWVSAADVTPPTITHTPVTAAVADTQIAIDAIISDAGTVNAEIWYGSSADGNTFTNHAAMTKGSGNDYTGYIPAQTAGDVYYYIKAVDNSTNAATYPSDITACQHIVVSATDSIPPVITHTPVTKSYENLNIALTAAVTDNSPVTVEIWYGDNADGNTFTNHAAMTKGTGNDFTGSIPGQTVDVYYFIKATDSNGNTATSPAVLTSCNKITIPHTLTMADARSKATGTAVTVSGTVTLKDGDTYYVQDNTGAIAVYRSGLTVQVGDNIIATGPLALYNGLLEVKPTSGADIIVLSSGNAMPQAKDITLGEIDEAVESQLVKIENLTLGTIAIGGDTVLTDVLGTQKSVYKIPDLTATGIVAGDKVNVTAVITQVAAGYKLKVGAAADVQKFTAETTKPRIIHTPVTNALANTPITINSTVYDASTVTAAVYYGTTADGSGFADYVAMTKGTGSDYSASIPSQHAGHVYYYVKAVDGFNNIATYPSDISSSQDITVTSNDIIPPVINHTPVTSGLENSPIVLTAAITDDSAMNAVVYYGTTADGSSFTDFVPMVQGTDNTYTATIPGRPAGPLYYYIKATDIYNNAATSPAAITSCNSINIIDIVTISEARAMAVNTTVTLSGVITCVDGGTFYTQDNTGGIAIYKSGLTLNVGDRVVATGLLADYNGLLEIKPANTTDVIVLSSGNPMPTPIAVNVADIKESAEAQLVKLENVTLGAINTTGDTQITDSAGGKIYINKIPSLTSKGIVAGDKVNVIAVVTQTSTTPVYKLKVRTADDVEKLPDTVPPVITHTPVTTGNCGIDLTISASITDDSHVSSATLYYRAVGQVTYQSMPMTLANGVYSATITKDKLSVSGIEYYIEAGDGTNTATAPTPSPQLVSISAEDITGPEVTNKTPEDGTNAGNNFRPIISASYSDPSGIQTSSIKITLDGNDITSSATVTELGFTFTPAEDLARGNHTVVLEAADNTASHTKSTVQWSFSVGEVIYNTYFGQLHSHTNLSDGQGTPTDAYTWARDNGDADFLAVTDHSNSLDNDTANGGLTDWKNSTSTEWKQLHEIADSFNKDGEFVAIAGFEMSWSGSTGGWGHINTFNTDWFETRNNSAMNLSAYYNKIGQDTDSISQLNHPGKTFGDFGDFGFYSEAADNVVKLVEVGNGEGQVRGSGYFQSYEYYTRALDKGWHLAPSNNQDNHKAGWITANDARTVILAPSLTRENIYDAIRNMRVYSTEDKNLKIGYTVNGKQMGTILSSPSKLSFNISFNDPDAADRIQKISIICDGGTVAASKTFDSNSGSWTFELDPQYNYYYVRIEEADQDIAVTAPVWTSEVTPVGLSKVEVSQNTTLVNTPVSITATAYNNGTTALPSVNVEFYKDSIADGNKIGQAAVAQIAAGASGTASINWTPDAVGSYKIYAKTTINIGGSDKVFTESTAIEVVNKGDVLKVVIDAGHYNQYVSGDYAGKVLALKSMLTDKKFMVVENKDALTAEDLQDAKLLIMTDPQGKDKTTSNLYKSLYTDAEVAAIKDFVNNGGALIMTSRADYDDKGITDGSYQSAAQGNKVLAAIGSNLRFNDDEVVDNTENAGQAFRLFFDEYISSKFGLTTITDGSKYSFYSGCSVVVANGGSGTDVDILVKGHATTETLDSDTQSDNTPVNKGEVNALAAEILPSGGKVVVGGSTFFSDFELTGDNLNSNNQITKNIIDWMVKPKEAALKTISEVRVDADNNGVPDLLGQKFAVEGRVTAQSVAVGTNNAFFDVIYVQDETGGITVFGVSTKAIPLGAKVKVTGVVDQYDGDAEIQISNENTDIIITDSTVQLVEPQVMTTASSMLEANEGKLVKIEGKVTKITSNALYLDDGTGEARVYVNGYIGDGTSNPDMLGKWDKNIGIGDTVSAVGLAAQDPEGHRLRVRNTAEIVRVAAAVIPAASVELNTTAATIKVNEEIILTATVKPENATNKNVTWTSGKPEVAQVTNGVVKGISAGTTDITVKTEDGSYTAECSITVTVPVTGIELDKAAASVQNGKEITLTATVKPENATNKKVVWTSGKPEIAQVTNGVVKGMSVGTADITAKTEDGSFTAVCKVTVMPIPVTGIILDKSYIYIEEGRGEVITATVMPENATNKNIIWTSSKPDKASVKDGAVFGVESGTATITATTEDGSFSAECTVKVKAVKKDDKKDDKKEDKKEDKPGEQKKENKYELSDTSVTVVQNGSSSEVRVDENALINVSQSASKEQGSGQDKENQIVVIAPNVAATASTVSVEVSKKGLDTISANNQNLEINIGTSSIQLSPEVMKNLPNTERIKVEISRVPEGSVPQSSLSGGMRPAGDGVDFSVSDSSDKAVKLDGKIKIEVKLESGANKDMVGLYYYDEETGKLIFVGGKVNGDIIEGYTTHNSKYVVMEYNKSFKDVKEDSEYSKYINSMAAKHIITGYNDNTYRGENNISRAEIAVLICRALSIEPTAYKGSFKDVKAKDFSAGCIQSLYDLGIMRGAGDRFMPNANITREEMFAILGRILGNQKLTAKASLSTFADGGSLSQWALEGTQLAVEAKIIIAKDNKLDPKVLLTRNEAAAFIYRLYNL